MNQCIVSFIFNFTAWSVLSTVNLLFYNFCTGLLEPSISAPRHVESSSKVISPKDSLFPSNPFNNPVVVVFICFISKKLKREEKENWSNGTEGQGENKHFCIITPENLILNEFNTQAAGQDLPFSHVFLTYQSLPACNYLIQPPTTTLPVLTIFFISWVKEKKGCKGIWFYGSLQKTIYW